MDKLMDHKDYISQIKNDNECNAKRMTELNELIFNTDGKMDVFDKYEQKITACANEIKVVENKFDNINKDLTSRMDDVIKHSDISFK